MDKLRLQARAKRLQTDIPAVWIALREPETPAVAKIIAGIIVCYALSPIDLVPDFIPVLGYLDDIIILPALVALLIACIPADVWAHSREKSADIWKGGKPKRWYYAIPVALVWGLLLFWLCRAVWRRLRAGA